MSTVLKPLPAMAITRPGKHTIVRIKAHCSTCKREIASGETYSLFGNVIDCNQCAVLLNGLISNHSVTDLREEFQEV